MTKESREELHEDSPRAFFEAEVERLTDRLYGTALRLTRHRTDAEDLVADALSQAWARLPDLQDRQAFEKWIFRILVNGFVSERRKKQARPREVAAELDGEQHFSLFERMHQPFLLWWGNPEQQLLDKLLREDIEKAVEELPEDFRLVVVMVELWGFSYAETAETLAIPVGTVRSRLSRGRGLLQRALWRHADEAGLTRASTEGGAR